MSDVVTEFRPLSKYLEAITAGRNIGVVDMVELYTPIIKKLVGMNHQLEAVIMEKSAFGGPCLRCKQDYVQVVDKGKYHTMIFFEPGCKCYPTCKTCGRKLHFEVELNQRGCSHCYWPECQEIREVEEYNEKTRKRTVKNVSCGGILVPVRGGFRCDRCGIAKAD